MIAHLPQRLRDWLLERRIASLQSNVEWTYKHGSCWCNDYDVYGRVAVLDAEIAHMKAKRSPSQLKRMGVHADKLKLE